VATHEKNLTAGMRYLLGTLTEEEKARFEAEYFLDNNAFEEMEVAEDDLVDAYVHNQLSAEDGECFERILESSERLDARVQFARMMMTSIASRGEVHPEESSWRRIFSGLPGLASRGEMPASQIHSAARPGFRIAFAACVVAVIAAGLLLTLRWVRLRAESRQMIAEKSAIETQKQELAQQLANQKARTAQLNTEVENARATNERLTRELEEAKNQLSNRQSITGLVASILLLSSGSRSPGEPGRDSLVVNKGVRTIQLKLVLDEDNYTSYRAVLKSADDRNVLSLGGLKSREQNGARVVSFQFPSDRLPEGDHAIGLTGRTPSGKNEFVADYRFRLTKK
jgi:hypothetical protein